MLPFSDHTSADAPLALTASTVQFDVANARALRRRYRRLNPGARVVRAHSWNLAADVVDGGVLERLAHRCRRTSRSPAAATTLWYWEDDAIALRAQARDLLLRFVHPLVAGDRPYCIGFPFAAAVLEPRSLTLPDRADLDLEDLGTLLTSGATPAAATAPYLADRQAPARGWARPAGGSHVAAHAGLDAAQAAAVRHGNGAARVLAAAGSGKTRTLIARVAELVARGVDPSRILLLAFNTKAAEQLEERLAERGIATTRHIELGQTASAVHCATFNAFGARYQREVMRRRIRIDMSGRQTRALMRRAMNGVCGGLSSLEPACGADAVEALVAALPRVRAGLQAPEGITVSVLASGGQPVADIPLAGVHTEYARLQTLSGNQSFDDQIYFALVDLLATPAHRRAVQRLYRHVLVDEFQDLNPAQLALVDVLSRPSRDLFVAGDDDQLIYGWRFADPTALLGFHERVPSAPLSATYTLATNYRSSRAVVHAAARLVANNTARAPKVMRPRADAQEGAVLFAAAASWAERGQAMCAFLRAERARLSCSWSDLAVLCRYRSQQFAVALALDAANLPRSPNLSDEILAHPAARLVRACLALVVEPDDEAAHRLMAKLPPDASRERVDRAVHAVRLRLSKDLPYDGSARTLLPAKAQTTAGAVLGAVIEALALDERCRGAGYAASRSDNGDLRARHGDGGGLFEVADGLAALAEAYPEPSAFFAAWDRLATDEAAPPGRPASAPAGAMAQPADDGVTVATIHAAKGREYAAAVIADYDCDISAWSPAEIEEERRVLYVALTRARDSVLLTLDSSRPYVHPFLRELVASPGPTERGDIVARLASQPDDDARRHLERRLTELTALYPGHP